MNKPLSDWTLSEVKEECKKHNKCDGCYFHGSNFCSQTPSEKISPCSWDLTDPKPTWTKQEIEDAKTLIRILPEKIEKITRVSSNGNLLMTSYGSWRGYLGGNAFPSLRVGESADIQEIANFDISNVEEINL